MLELCATLEQELAQYAEGIGGSALTISRPWSLSRAGAQGRGSGLACLLVLGDDLHALHDVVGHFAVEVLAGRGAVGGGLGGHGDSISSAIGRRGRGGA